MPHKQCPSCKSACGCRATLCKCGYNFATKTVRRTTGKKKFNKAADWREFRAGDQIKITRGSGPYWRSPTGDRTYLTDGGNYKVVNVYKDGFSAYSSEFGFCFVLMVPKGYNEETGVFREPHKVLLYVS